MAKKERISAQDVLETISGFMEVFDVEKLQKLDQLDNLSSMTTSQSSMEKRLTAVEQKLSDVVKPGDFEEKLKKRDDAFNKAIKTVPTEVHIKNEPVSLAQKDRDSLDELTFQLEKRNKRFSEFCRVISYKKIWFLFLFLMTLLSVSTTILVMNRSSKEWAHRILVAAIDMNYPDPIGQYLTCRAEMPHNRKEFKQKVKAMEYDAKKILYLESILADYITGEFSVEQYESRKTDLLEYAVICRFAGVKDTQVFNIHIKDDKVVEVLRRYENTKKKKKDDPEFVWKEVKLIRD